MGLDARPDPKTGIYQLRGTVAGRRIRKSAKTCDGRAARFAAQALERKIWAGLADGTAETVTFEVAAIAYMQADNSARFIKPLVKHFAGRDIKTILPGHVQDAARALYPTHKPATQNRQGITPASAILNHAAERGWCAPIRIKRFPEEKVSRVAADREWLDAFMAEAEPHIAALALFMFTTGARISEALSLRWEDVEGRNAFIRKTKSGESRTAICPRETTLRMRDLQPCNERVFRYRSRRWVYPKWKAACAQAGIPYIRPHQAGRHAFATEMIVRNRVDAHTTAKLGGWAGTRMLDRYAHPERLEGVVDEVFAMPGPKARKAE